MMWLLERYEVGQEVSIAYDGAAFNNWLPKDCRTFF